MTNQERFDKFQKVFPLSEHTLKTWEAITSWDTPCPFLLRLDMSIFPDSLEAIVWNFTSLNHVTFCPTQVSLVSVTFDGTNVNVIKICPEQKLIKHLSLNSPVVKLSLGGSLPTVEDLYLSNNIPLRRVSIPVGMTALKSLHVGSRHGTVILPKDIVNLTSLVVSVGDTPSVKIPNECSGLTNITVHGGFSKISLPKDLPKDLSLYIDSHAPKLVVPRHVTPKNLTLCGDSIVMSKAIWENVEVVHLRTNSDVVVPNTAVGLKSLSARGGMDAVSISKGVDGLVNIDIAALGKIDIKGDLSKASRITTNARDIKIHSGQTLDIVETLWLNHGVDGSTSIKLPKVLPELINASSHLAGDLDSVDAPKFAKLPPRMVFSDTTESEKSESSDVVATAS